METRELIKMVKMIKSYPFLYNNTIPEYCDKDLCDSTWKKIASASKLTVAQTKDKWRNLRNGYARSFKPLSDGTKSRKRYYLANELEFLYPFLKSYSKLAPSRNTEDQYNYNDIYFDQPSDDKEDNNDDTDSDSADGDNPLAVKVKTEKATKENFSEQWLDPDVSHTADMTDVNDDDDVPSKRARLETNHREMFLLSLLPEVEKLSDEQMLNFKVKVLTMLSLMLAADS